MWTRKEVLILNDSGHIVGDTKEHRKKFPLAVPAVVELPGTEEQLAARRDGVEIKMKIIEVNEVRGPSVSLDHFMPSPSEDSVQALVEAGENQDVISADEAVDDSEVHSGNEDDGDSNLGGGEAEDEAVSAEVGEGSEPDAPQADESDVVPNLDDIFKEDV